MHGISYVLEKYSGITTFYNDIDRQVVFVLICNNN